ncbi:hypothetical protein K503DRAFT_788388, partial [Rhizopogon vinicolor AM-OR11-026]
YPNDGMTFKAMCDTAHQILGTIGVWQYLVSNYGNYVFPEETHVPLFLAIVFSVIVSTMAKLSLTYIIWQLSDGIRIFPAFLIPAALAQLVIACVEGLTNISVQNLYNLRAYPTAGNAIAAGTDIVIAMIMCTLLARRRQGLSKRTDSMLARLIILSVNCGLWTSAFALLT